MIKTLSSRDNPRIKLLHGLANSARDRRKHGLTLLDGVHLVDTALTRGFPIRELFVSDDGLRNPEITHLLSLADATPVTLLAGKLFLHVSPVDAPSGILALIDYPADVPVTRSEGKSLLLLEGIQDPGNLGSILRTAAAAGLRDVFLTTQCTQAWSPRTLRAGMGGHFELDIHENVAPLALLDGYRGRVIATALSAGSQSLYSSDFRGPVAWLFGSEGQGLSAELFQRADVVIRIPMAGAVESLNVGAAVAVCLFEQLRQQTTAS